MRLATSRPTTQSERIYALEEGRKADAERLGKMETQLKEIHDLLFGARAIIWFVGKVLAWVGGPSAIAGAAFVAWKTFVR
jgi:hypothetical protein